MVQGLDEMYMEVGGYRIAGKFGSLAVYITTAKLKFAKMSYLHIYADGDPVLNRQI